jgi:glycosyltransferase involved in cell wall biosynthesis
MNKQYLISIITVVYNGANTLEQTILSVINQTYKNIEYVIIDGNSIDGTVDIIKKYTDQLAYWISESDNGIYYAMNKGLNKVTGDFVIFLNSGDTLYNQTVLYDVVDIITCMNSLYFGCAKVINRNGRFYLLPRLNSDANSLKQFLNYYKPNHQTIFFPKIFFSKNQYNTQYKIASDEDYKIRSIQSCGYVFFNKIIVSFAAGGFSYPNTIKKIRCIIWEYSNIHKTHGTYCRWYHIRLIISLFLKYFFSSFYK